MATYGDLPNGTGDRVLAFIEPAQVGGEVKMAIADVITAGGAITSAGLSDALDDEDVARLTIAQQFTATQSGSFSEITTSSSTLALNIGAIQSHAIRVTQNVTAITLGAAPTGFTQVNLFLFLDGGIFSVSGWPSEIEWHGGVAPAMPAVGGAKMEVVINYYNDVPVGNWGGIT